MVKKKSVDTLDFGKPVKVSIIAYAENDWVKKMHTLSMAGNGAALLLLGSFMSKGANPVSLLQENKWYFAPFVIGIIVAGIAPVIGAFDNVIEHAINETSSEEKILARKSLPDFSGNIGDKDKILAMKLLKYRTTRRANGSNIVKLLIFSGTCFLFGIFMLAFAPDLKNLLSALWNVITPAAS